MRLTKWYDGPDGVFYNQYLDEVFLLIWSGGEWYNWETQRQARSRIFISIKNKEIEKHWYYSIR